MPGKITHVPSDATIHDQRGCQDRPSPYDYARGTIWTCDECGSEWVVVHGAQYNEAYTAWRRLTERNRDGIE